MSSTSATPPARLGLLGAGLFLTTAAILMLEVSLTRILSVIMWYHFAFLAISVALFGLAASGLAVYLLPKWFRAERAVDHAFLAAIGLALAVPATFWMLAANPAYRHFTTSFRGEGSASSPAALAGIAALYLVGALPFFVGGLVGATLFRHFGRAASRLYFLDLVGAGIGCAATVPVLDQVGGPGAMAVVSALAALAAACFGAARGDRRRVALAALLAVVAATVAVTNPSTGLLKLRYFRGRAEPDLLIERWNSFSRVGVRDTGSPDSLLIEIDSASNTIASRWDGRVESVAPLRDGLIAVQYALVERPRVLVIGSGGGVDLLTAVASGARSITAVEVNPIIVDLMTHKYAEFSGGIYLRPEVTVVTDEARSHIRRSGERWDVIQAGYVDTYAATAAGAFSLTENTLYTRQAFRDYLTHLTPDGIVSIQRYFEEPPQQTIRLVSLALAALADRGDQRPWKHVVVMRQGDRASMLMKNSEFTEEQVARLEAHAARTGLEVVAAPGRAGQGLYGRLLNAPDPRAVIAGYALDISPVGDDRPFFFYVVKPIQFWRGLLIQQGERVNARAVFLLTALLLVAAVACVAMLVLPGLAAAGRRPALRAGLPAMGWFAMLGLGFMLVEIGLLQRLMLFLGHPTMALGVVLTTLLVSAGLGASLTRGVTLEHSERALRLLTIGVLGMVALIALAWPPLFESLVGLERPARIAIAVAALTPVGLVLGTLFPLGVRRLAEGRPELIPWAWAVNGATSVLGSILAMVVAINNGFTATILLGGLCYVVALVLVPATALPAAEPVAEARPEPALETSPA